MAPIPPHPQLSRQTMRLARPWVAWPLAAILPLAGCATGVPDSIRDPSATTVEVSQVQTQPNRYLGQRVRWGGTILGVSNREHTTEIEVLSRRLGHDGAPVSDSRGQGRFIAEVPGFLDPAEYAKDRKLTLVGTLSGMETRPVGDYPYRYPVLRVESRHLWPKPVSPGLYGPPYPWFSPWYDPWYDPFYRPVIIERRRHRR